MLKMELNQIRGQIQIHPENWINIYSTNCYAYALGLDVNELNICQGAYQPGTIAGIYDIAKTEYFSYDDLIKGLEGDLKVLDISYRKIEPQEEILSDEWKIALFIEEYHGELIDFHFLRAKDNEIWFHKNGFKGTPSKKDYLGRIITDPKTSSLSPYTYAKCYALRFNER